MYSVLIMDEDGSILVKAQTDGIIGAVRVKDGTKTFSFFDGVSELETTLACCCVNRTAKETIADLGSEEMKVIYDALQNMPSEE